MDSIGIKKLCEICHVNQSHYTCPKCSIPYCNSKCYSNIDKHFKCSEDFYKDQVVSQLEQIKIEDRKSIVDILKRAINSNDGGPLDGDDYADQSDTEHDNSDDEEISDEQHSSSAETQTKLVNFYEKQLKDWKPWWVLFEERKKKISSLDENNREMNRFVFNQRLINNSKEIKISETSLNNTYIINDLVQITYVYILLTYIYQDDLPHDDINLDLCFDFIDIENRILKKNVISSLNDRLVLIRDSLLNSTDVNLKTYYDKEFLIKIIDDLILLIQDKYNILQVLSRLYDYLSEFITSDCSAQEIDPNLPVNVFHVNKSIRKFDKIRNVSVKKSARLLVKRVEFYYAWLIENDRQSKLDLVLDESVETIKIAMKGLWSEHKSCENEELFIKKNFKDIRNNLTIKDKKTLIAEVQMKNQLE
jgi:hypothetical protein